MPELMKGLGKGMSEFKKVSREDCNDEKSNKKDKLN